MEAALILGAGLMGLAGTPHCAAMCGAPCAAVTQRCGPSRQQELMAGFMAGRVVGYAVGGAVVAASVAALGTLGGLVPALRPLWTALHLAVLGLGLWLLITGRQPAWWARLGSPRVPAALPGGWQRVSAPLRAGAAGSLWVALPCGLLQSALLIAALATTPLQGAAAMASFAVASSLGLWLPGAVWARAPMGAGQTSWALRAAGASLVVASGWAVGHGLWERVAAFCLAA